MIHRERNNRNEILDKIRKERARALIEKRVADNDGIKLTRPKVVKPKSDERPKVANNNNNFMNERPIRSAQIEEITDFALEDTVKDFYNKITYCNHNYLNSLIVGNIYNGNRKILKQQDEYKIDIPSDVILYDKYNIQDVNKFNLLINYFYNENRNEEYLICIKNNLKNVFIKNIYVFIEREEDVAHLPKDDKIKIVKFSKRTTYNDFFNFANKNLIGENIIVANTDIVFDHTLQYASSFDLTGHFIALTRYDIKNPQWISYYNCPHSQDAWLFNSPIPDLKADFFLGVPGCDSRIAHLASEGGLITSNPSLLIFTKHLHLSNYRAHVIDPGISGLRQVLFPTNSMYKISKKIQIMV